MKRSTLKTKEGIAMTELQKAKLDDLLNEVSSQLLREEMKNL